MVAHHDGHSVNPRLVAAFRAAIGFLILFGMFAALLGIPQPVQAAPSREPIYYLSMPEDNSLQAFYDNGGAGAAVAPVRSVTSIAIATNGTIIYYDHWENGFAADIRTGADLVFGDGNLGNGCPPSLNNTPNPCLIAGDDTLQAADVVVLDNLVAVVGAPGGPYSRNPAQVFFDGRDKFQATSPIAAGRALWPTGPGSLQAGGVEMLEYNRWGDLYRFPFGESAIFPTGLFEDVRYYVVAGPGGSTIDVDTNGDSIVDATYVLAEGGKQVIHAPSAGGTIRVVSGSNVQVTLAYSDTADTYEMRWSALIPYGDWSNDYYSPVGTAAGNLCTNVWVYNPNPAPITVSWTLGNPVANGSFVVPAGASAASNTTVGLNRGIRLYTAGSEIFLPFSVTDCSSSGGNQGQIFDWDTSLFPSEQLSAEILVGWAPGCTNESHLGMCRDADGSPAIAGSVSRSVVWITPLANTTIYVDTNGSGISCPSGAGAEQTIAAFALASYRIDDDPSSQSNVRDQFDTNSYTGNNGSQNWSANWTETDAGGGGAGGGYAYVTNNELRFRDTGGNEVGTIVRRPRNLAGQTYARFSFRIQSTAAEAGDDIAVEVTSNGTNWYLLERIQAPVTFPGANFANKIYNISPYISASTAIRFRMLEDLEANEYWQIDNVNIQYAPDGDFDMTGAYIRTCDGTQIAAAYGQNPSTSESGDNEALDLGTVITPYYVLIDVELDKQVTDDTPNLGDAVTFTLRVANTGPVTARNIDVTDVVPNGYTYVPGTIAGGDTRDASNPATTGLTWRINSLASGAFADLTYGATVLANDSGARIYDNYSEIEDHTQPDNDSTPGNGSTTEDDDDTVTVTPNGSVRGSVLADTNNDNVGDAPLANATLTLFTDPNGDGDPSDGAPVGFDVDPVTPGTQSSVVSQVDGSYNFASVPAGVYVVVQTDLAGYQSVTDGDSTADMPGSPVDAANASPTDNWLPVNLASAELDSGNDFVDEQSAAIGDYVWYDDNADGVQDLGESGLDGVRVYVDSNSNDAYDLGEPTGVTAGGGLYNIGGLAAGTYDARVDTTTLPPGYVQTYDLDGIGTAHEASVAVNAGQLRTDVDFGYYLPNPALTLVKRTNGQDANTPPGPTLTVGSPVTWTFEVTNSGNVALTNVTVTDDQIANDPADIDCGSGNNVIASLGLGAATTCTASASALAGQYSNLGTASSTYAGNPLADTDPSHYFGADAAIQVVKEVSVDGGLTWQDANAAPGPSLASGTDPQFRFTVTNTGNVTLTNLTLLDSDFSTVSCTIPASLAPTASYACTISAPWASGQHTDTATANGNFGGTTYSDTDDANYFGADAAIQVVKEVSVDSGTTWQDANAAPGPSLVSGTDPQFRFTVTNTGNVTLTGLTLTDSDFSTLACTIPASLAPAASYACTLTTAWASGQHTDTATANGNFGGTTYSDTDDANYFGADAAIQVVKEVSVDSGTTWQDANAAPGPSLVSGTDPQFRFTVTNTGNVTLTGLTLTDSDFDTSSCTVPGSLAPAGTFSCTISPPWASGQHTDTATANGDFGGTTYSDTDDANYFGADAAIQVVKEVSVDGGLTWQDANAAPGPSLVSGTDPQFRFTVTNTGNVTLTGLTLTDSDFSTLACTIPASLAPAASYACTLTTAWASGQHTDTATANGNFGGTTYSDTDDANYFGADAAIQVVKEVSVDSGTTWQDANAAPGPSLVSGTDPQFRFTVTNTGNVTLTGLTLTDSDFSTLACTIPASLAPAASYACTLTTAWASGQHTDTATANGRYTDSAGTLRIPSDTDDANYFGADAAIQVVKEVSVDSGTTWQDANAAPGPSLVSGTDPQFRFTVTNTGNVTLTGLTLTDSDFSTLACTIPASLAPAASYACTLTTAWASGQHTDTATANGRYTDSAGTLRIPSDTDDANYFGADAAIQVVKEVSVDGGLTWQDANAAPGPSLVSGTDPQFRFTVTNTGNVTLTGLTLTDSDFSTLACTIPASLAPAASYACTLTTAWASGQHTDTATANGLTLRRALTYSDTDDANYFGADAAIQVVKEVSVDSGTTWQDANAAPGPSLVSGTDPQFRFTVTNTGNVTLTGLTLTDSDFSTLACTIPASLAPAASYACTLTAAWASGQHTDTATANGRYTDSAGTLRIPSDTDDANYFGADAAIQVVKEVSVDGGLTWQDANAAPGP